MSKIVVERSGLCHGPGCQEKITDRGPSDDFCSEGCSARWQAAYVSVAPDPALLGVQLVVRAAGTGPCAPPPASPGRVAAWLEAAGDFELTDWQRQILAGLPDGQLRVHLNDECSSAWLDSAVASVLASEAAQAWPSRDELLAVARQPEIAPSLRVHLWLTRDVTDARQVICELCGHPYVGGGPIPPRCTPVVGRRVHLAAGEYEVTEAGPGRAVLTPVDETPRPVPWWRRWLPW